jgi:hypothetical protein
MCGEPTKSNTLAGRLVLDGVDELGKALVGIVQSIKQLGQNMVGYNELNS